MRLGRKKFIMLPGPREGITACHRGPRERHQCPSRGRWARSSRGFKPEPLLVSLQERQDRPV